MRKIEGNIIDPENRKTEGGVVYIENGKITKIEKSDKLYDNYIIPGFIDANVNIESKMISPREWCRKMVSRGVVACIWNPFILTNLYRTQGLEIVKKLTKNLPLKMYYCLPFMQSLKKIAGGENISVGSEILQDVLKDNRFKVLGENFNHPFMEEESRVRLCEKYGKINSAYMYWESGEWKKTLETFGSCEYVFSNICSSPFDENVFKSGKSILISDEPYRGNFKYIKKRIRAYHDKIIFSSGVVNPGQHNCDMLSLARKMKVNLENIDSYSVIEMTSVNAKKTFGLDVGMLRVGDPADFIVVKNITDFEVLQTYINGNLVFEKNKKILRAQEVDISSFSQYTSEFSKAYLYEGVDFPKIEKLEVIDKTSYSKKNVKEFVKNDKFNGEMDETEVRKLLKKNEEGKTSNIKRRKNMKENDEQNLKMFFLISSQSGSGEWKWNYVMTNICDLSLFVNKDLEFSIATTFSFYPIRLLSIGTSKKLISKTVDNVRRMKGGICVIIENEKMSFPLEMFSLLSNKSYKVIDKKYEDLMKFISKLFTEEKNDDGKKKKKSFKKKISPDEFLRTISYLPLLVMPCDEFTIPVLPPLALYDYVLLSNPLSNENVSKIIERYLMNDRFFHLKISELDESEIAMYLDRILDVLSSVKLGYKVEKSFLIFLRNLTLIKSISKCYSRINSLTFLLKRFLERVNIENQCYLDYIKFLSNFVMHYPNGAFSVFPNKKPLNFSVKFLVKNIQDYDFSTNKADLEKRDKFFKSNCYLIKCLLMYDGKTDSWKKMFTETNLTKILLSLIKRGKNHKLVKHVLQILELILPYGKNLEKFEKYVGDNKEEKAFFQQICKNFGVDLFNNEDENEKKSNKKIEKIDQTLTSLSNVEKMIHTMENPTIDNSSTQILRKETNKTIKKEKNDAQSFYLRELKKLKTKAVFEKLIKDKESIRSTNTLYRLIFSGPLETKKHPVYDKVKINFDYLKLFYDYHLKDFSSNEVNDDHYKVMFFQLAGWHIIKRYKKILTDYNRKTKIINMSNYQNLTKISQKEEKITNEDLEFVKKHKNREKNKEYIKKKNIMAKILIKYFNVTQHDAKNDGESSLNTIICNGFNYYYLQMIHKTENIFSLLLEKIANYSEEQDDKKGFEDLDMELALSISKQDTSFDFVIIADFERFFKRCFYFVSNDNKRIVFNNNRIFVLKLMKNFLKRDETRNEWKNYFIENSSVYLSPLMKIDENLTNKLALKLISFILYTLFVYRNELLSKLSSSEVDLVFRVGKVAYNKLRVFMEKEKGAGKLNTCDFCGKRNPTKRCAKCKLSWYCDQNCQRQHWKEHKAICLGLITEEKKSVSKGSGKKRKEKDIEKSPKKNSSKKKSKKNKKRQKKAQFIIDKLTSDKVITSEESENFREALHFKKKDDKIASPQPTFITTGGKFQKISKKTKVKKFRPRNRSKSNDNNVKNHGNRGRARSNDEPPQFKKTNNGENKTVLLTVKRAFDENREISFAESARVNLPSNGEKACDELIKSLIPSIEEDRIRKKIFEKVKGIFFDYGLKCYLYGSVALGTYLIGYSDIDLTVFTYDNDLYVSKSDCPLMQFISKVLERNNFKGVSEINSINPIIKSQYIYSYDDEEEHVTDESKNKKVILDLDFSFNKIHSMKATLLFERISVFIGKKFLFKRCVILIKSYFRIELEILGGNVGLFGTYALNVISLMIFNLFHKSIKTPFDFLCKCVKYLRDFDWKNKVLTVWGAIDRKDIQNRKKVIGKLMKQSKYLLSKCTHFHSICDFFNQKDDFLNETYFFNIIDPMDINNNLGKNVKSVKFVLDKFKFADGWLEKKKNNDEEFKFEKLKVRKRDFLKDANKFLDLRKDTKKLEENLKEVLKIFKIN